MSFLEMLDLLNEDLQTKGEAPVAFEHDCREGICGIVRIPDQRRGARRTPRHHGLPALDALLQGRRFADARTVARARPFPCCAIWPWIVPRSTASFRPAASSPRRPAARRTPMRFWCPRKPRNAPLTPPPASAAARAWLPAPMPRPCSLPPRRSLISTRCRRDSRSAISAPLDMVAAMSEEVFGSCTNHGECEAVCPKKIPIEFIGRMNRDLIHATLHHRGK